MELTKLGLGMTEATGLLRRHVWVLSVTAGPGTAHAGNLVTNATVSPAPPAHPARCPLSEIDFKEQVFRGCHYYFKCNYHSNAENVSLSTNDFHFCFLSDGLLGCFFFFFLP